MIARLRRRHGVAVLGLWLLLPLALFLYSAAAPAPRMAELPQGIRSASPSADEVEWLVSDAETGIELGRVGSGPAKGRLALRPLAPLKRPDVLVYWLASSPSAGDGVPEDAVFAGRLDGARAVSIAIPSEAGGLLLFSLGHQERVGWIDLGPLHE